MRGRECLPSAESTESPVCAQSCPILRPQTAAHQAPLCMELSRQEYWSRLPFPTPRDLPNPGNKPVSPALAGGFFTPGPPGKPLCYLLTLKMSGLEYPPPPAFFFFGCQSENSF